jgi:uncharacterized protein (TIGR02284 family)
METIEKSVEILNDLIRINNDRIAGYEHAFNELEDDDFDLKTIFQNYREESIRNVVALTAEVEQSGDDAEHGASAGGTLHRAWLDVKSSFAGHSRKSILEECERGEAAIKTAYTGALDYNSGLSPELRPLLTRQEEAIFNAHDKIKGLRDIYE